MSAIRNATTNVIPDYNYLPLTCLQFSGVLSRMGFCMSNNYVVFLSGRCGSCMRDTRHTIASVAPDYNSDVFCHEWQLHVCH